MKNFIGLCLLMGLLIPFSSFAQFFLDKDTLLSEEVVEKITTEQIDTTKILFPEFLALENDSLYKDSTLWHQSFRKEILAYYYFYKEYKEVGKVLANLRKYFPFVDSTLRDKKLPSELKYIALIESALDKKARSSAGALGIWQFMPETARDYGLRVNLFVDERYCPEKSTWAVVKHFKRLFEKYEDWKLVLSAYNWGEGNLDELIEEKKTKHYFSLYQFMPQETKAYLACYIAAFNFFEEKQKEFKEEENPLRFIFKSTFVFPPKIEILKNKYTRSLRIFAKQNQLNYKILKDLNSELVTDIVPANYKIKIPYRESKKALKNETSGMEDVYAVMMDFMEVPVLEL